MPAEPIQTIAHRVKEVRKARGLTAQQLGERMTAEGVRWDRFTVANLEKGKRQNVTVTELLTLAATLNVAPIHLLVPIDADPSDEYAVTPQTSAPIDVARSWMRGQRPLPGAKRRDFAAQAPEGEWVSFDVTTPEGMREAASFWRTWSDPVLDARSEGGEGGEPGEAAER